MKKKISALLTCLLIIGLFIGCSNEEDKFIKVPNEPKQLPVATIEVEGFGTMKVELYPHKAPNTVNNFISLANSKYYDGLIFHRIIEGFMAQGGCPNGTGTGGPGYSIAGEFKKNGFDVNDIKHTKGVISMARAQDMDSAGSQFFIMTADAPHLDNEYAAFGKVIEGMDIVDKLNKVKTKAPGSNDKPVDDVVIKSIRVETFDEKYDEPVKVK